jgi:two-component system sensor histidine kinase BaeS
MLASLRNKLILTFVAISVIGTLISAVIVGRINDRALNELLLEQAATDFLREVQIYYQIHGSWADITQSFRPDNPPPSAPIGLTAQDPPPFALADVNGRVILPNGQYLPGNRVPAPALAQGIPVLFEGVRIGTVLEINQPPPMTPQQKTFMNRTNQALLYGALGATVTAVLLAILLARTLTRPLGELAAASRQMARGKLGQTVNVRAQDELGDLAAAFNQMSADLARADKQRQQMTADIAHDLRTPLTVLAGYLEAMADGTLPATAARLALMQDEVETLQRLVADLRTLSLAESGRLTLQKETIATAAWLHAVHDAFTPQAAAREINLELELTEPLPAVSVDGARMRQVLGNLLANALRYTPADGSVRIAARAGEDGRLQLQISDTGPGIPAADLPHIFDRFYRGDKARSGDEGASGLGLAIAKSLVAAHQGTIDVASSPKGTIFTITIPQTA